MYTHTGTTVCLEPPINMVEKRREAGEPTERIDTRPLVDIRFTDVTYTTWRLSVSDCARGEYLEHDLLNILNQNITPQPYNNQFQI